jgi:pyruvate/2-oxoglutarate dehydrogenase complex dihydrolipoamide acyltransferase (E2) component
MLCKTASNELLLQEADMKYLDALKQSNREPKKSVLPNPENKMQPGTRAGQRNKLDPKDPQSLISSPRANSSASSNSNDQALQKLAGELDVDLSVVTGTGPNGTITEKDVRNAKK